MRLQPIFFGIILVLILITVPKLIENFHNQALLSDIILKKTTLKQNLNLALFYQWTKEDPLFTSPDFDADGFNKAVSELEKQQKNLLKILSSNLSIFPVDFLSEIPKVDKLHRDFMADPTLKKAEKLIEGYRQAEKYYSSSQQHFLHLLNTDPSVKKDYQFLISINNVSSFNIIRQDIERLGQNSLVLNREIEQREACLLKGAGCRRPLQKIIQPLKLQKQTTVLKKDLLPLEILFPQLGSNAPIFGPYLVSTPCFGWGPNFSSPTYPFYATETNSAVKLPVEVLKLATTNYYRQIIPSADKYLVDKGIAYILQPETSYYTCLNTSYQNKIASIDNLYRKYKSNFLFEKLLSDPSLPRDIVAILQEGNNQEKAFFESEMPSETQTDNLASYYAYTYSKIGQWKIASLYQTRDEFLNRYLEYNRQLAGFDKLLARNIDLFSTLIPRYLMYGIKDFNSVYLYRSMYGMLYFAFSPSFYRLNQPLTYLEKKYVTPGGQFLTYQQAVAKYGLAEVKKWQIDQAEALLQAFEQFKKIHPDLKEATAADK